MVWKIPIAAFIIFIVIIIIGAILWLYLSKRKIRYSIQKARRQGKLDAKKGRPLLNQTEFPQYIKKLLDVAEEEISRLAQDWEEKDKKLKADFCNAKFEMEEAEKARNKAREDFKSIESEFKETRKGLDKLEHVFPEKKIYWMVFWFLVLGEFPLNAIVFNLFGEAKMLTYLMAAVICFILPWGAHLTGTFLKQGLFKDKVTTTKFIIDIVIVFGVLVGIAYLRTNFFEASEVQKILNIEMSIFVTSCIFFFINALIFAVAATTSYFAHPRDPVTYRNIKWRFTEAFNNLKKSGASLRNIEVEYQRAVNKLELITSLREQSFDKQINKIPEIKNSCEIHIRAYTGINLRYCPKNEYPKCLKRKPVFEPLPKSLSILDWDCKEDKQ